MSKIILISGPTGSGKSKFAVKLAKKVKGEIINADSMQIYKEIKILTARPQKKDQLNIKHHLYGFNSVKKNFSSGDWLKLTTKKIKEIKKNNKIPIVVGGTGLYFKVLISGLVKLPNIPFNFRKRIRNLQKKVGQKEFYKKLIKLDPLSENKINLNDVQRSLRAYEIKKFSKKSIFAWFEQTNQNFKESDFVKIYIDFPRDDLIKKIKNRVDKMFKDGAIDEAIRFSKLRLKKENSANKIIGLNEIKKYLKGESNLLETKEKIYIKTRQYAKRQRTWARGQMSSWQKIHPKDLTLALKKFK